MRGERVVTSWRSVFNLYNTVLVNHTYVLASHWTVCERCAVIRKQKKNTIPAKIPARPYIKKFFLRVKLTDIMVDSREHIFSKNTRSVIELDKSFITSWMLIKHYVRTSRYLSPGLRGRRIFPSLFFLRGSHNVFGGNKGGVSRVNRV